MDMKISAGTIARTIFFFVSLANQICVWKGWTPIDLDENTIYETVSMIALAASSIMAWWKNNSFTTAALIGDKAKNEAKADLKA